jgi:hypothetical protein
LLLSNFIFYFKTFSILKIGLSIECFFIWTQRLKSKDNWVKIVDSVFFVLLICIIGKGGC